MLNGVQLEQCQTIQLHNTVLKKSMDYNKIEYRLLNSTEAIIHMIHQYESC
jgi:hypothetical protein